MHLLVTILGWLLASCALLSFGLGIAAWPPGGLMFALPYVFFFSAALVAPFAIGLIWLGRRLKSRSAEKRA